MNMKYRTIEEALNLKIPEFPEHYFNECGVLERIIKYGNESSISRLRKIYLLTDKLTSFVAPYMVCKKKCSHCCKIDVTITATEAQYIHKHHGDAVDPGKSISSGHAERKARCPFLDDSDACSIYELRPFVCRTTHAVDDPAFCEDINTEHVTYTSESHRLLDNLFKMVAHINGDRPIRDIRDFFPDNKA